ncbi:sulfurtransferase TusA family protein [Peptostreptococcus canis]|uniref:Sulfurtransferase TusA family protein n=1 Tax=Peptostreptococcus canis TaxID=1159213 RepID=A0ABR6TIC8_9FIRM|nr:sulfurtransferase TusA family protein [Peptostreptococcus canis]MBC2575166.1 sulfurtransferase TusA family protein [Peptostreptococcus canis]MBP1997659.1 TusA-related sulfurtransferase [Peptostreptococcus canis]
MKEIDVRGLSCPEPVLRVKNELDSGEEELLVIANEAHTVKNITKFCEKLGKKVTTEEVGLEYKLEIK